MCIEKRAIVTKNILKTHKKQCLRLDNYSNNENFRSGNR